MYYTDKFKKKSNLIGLMAVVFSLKMINFLVFVFL